MIKFWNKKSCNISDEARIGDGSIIHSHVVIYDDVVIGKDCKIQAFAFIPNGVTIGDRVFIGPRVTFTNDKYPPSNGVGWLPIVVHDEASIGAGAIILPGVTIGRWAKVGAGAIVTKDIPAGETWVGNPARKLK